MLNFLYNYGLFLLKIITLIGGFMIVVAFIAATVEKLKAKDKFKIKNLNDRYQEIRDMLNHEILNKKELKKLLKEEKQQHKKEEIDILRKRVFVINFKGDIKASAVQELREEVTAILEVAISERDEVVAIIESSGGMIPNYGLAASQLQRIRQRKIPLVAIIDKIAASGGYMMACVADQIYAAPFAIIGSIGVVAQLPNFNKLLKKHDIEYELITAGEYKRTLTLLGENTDKGRKKMKEDVEEAHELFKLFIVQNRPIVDIGRLATGEYWYGTKALELNLIDKIITSDDYLLNASKNAALYEVKYCIPAKKIEKVISSVKSAFNHFWL